MNPSQVIIRLTSRSGFGFQPHAWRITLNVALAAGALSLALIAGMYVTTANASQPPLRVEQTIGCIIDGFFLPNGENNAFVRDLVNTSLNPDLINFAAFEGRTVRFKCRLGPLSAHKFLTPDDLGKCDQSQINLSSKSMPLSEAWAARALKHLEVDNPQETLSAAMRAIMLRPDYCHAHMYRAFANYGIGNNVDAGADLVSAYTLGCHPTWAETRKNSLPARFRGLPTDNRRR